MSTQKQELYDVIGTLPEELFTKVIDYIEYIKFSYIMNEANTSADLVIKNKKDLIKKLEAGEKDIENKDVCSVDELFEGIDELLAN